VETTKKNDIVEITGYLIQWQNPRKKTEFEKLLVANSIKLKDVYIKKK